jgi:hypothetical protein
MKNGAEWASELLRVQDDDDVAILYVCGVELNRYFDIELAEKAADYFRKEIGAKIDQAVAAALAARSEGG